jgi:hypothetical protein
MSSKYFILPNKDANASWTFTVEDFVAAMGELWPEFFLGSEPLAPGDFKLTATIDGSECSFSYSPDDRVFTYPDQDPLTNPLRVILAVLSHLEPTTPTVGFADFIGEARYFAPISITAQELTDQLGD